MKKYNLVLGVTLLGVSSLLAGCQGDERIAEVSAKEKEAQIIVENKQATAMEKDLQTRQNFYQGVAGVYEGMAVAGSGSIYKIRIRLVSSLPVFTPNRTRMQEEVAADLNNLFFNAQVLLWNPETKIGAVGCRATGIRPDLNEGVIRIASTDCPNFYTIRIHDQALINGKVQGNSIENSARISHAMMEGKGVQAQSLYGEIQPTSTSDTLTFDAERYVE